MIKQLRCDVTDEWMWDVINNKWNNVSTNYRPENNIIEITSYVKANHIEKIGSCIFFTIRFSSYQNQCKSWIFVVNSTRYLFRGHISRLQYLNGM